MKIGFFGRRGEGPGDGARAAPTLERTLAEALRSAEPEPTPQVVERTIPPPLPPSLLRELEKIAGRHPHGIEEPRPPLGRAPAASLDYDGTIDGDMLDAIFACRERIESILAAETKEFHILKILNETDLGVCSDLATELHQRLSGHALYQILTKLDEAYRLALRYQKPGGQRG